MAGHHAEEIPFQYATNRKNEALSDTEYELNKSSTNPLRLYLLLTAIGLKYVFRVNLFVFLEAGKVVS